MPVAIRLLVPLVLWLRAFALLAFALVLVMVIRPALKGLAHPRGNIFKKSVLAPYTTVGKALLWVERRMESAVSHQAHASLGILTRWLSSAAALVSLSYREYARLAEANLEAFRILRHRTLPRVARTA